MVGWKDLLDIPVGQVVDCVEMRGEITARLRDKRIEMRVGSNVRHNIMKTKTGSPT